jgi:hypothetical protein
VDNWLKMLMTEAYLSEMRREAERARLALLAQTRARPLLSLALTFIIILPGIAAGWGD